GVTGVRRMLFRSILVHAAARRRAPRASPRRGERMTKRVLIAEDEESIVASLEFLMRRCGYETRVARDGDLALACLAEFKPDLVLLDIMLPGRSGFEVCRFIRSE